MSCKKDLTFEECELSIVRLSVDKIEKTLGKQMIIDPKTKQIINIIKT